MKFEPLDNRVLIGQLKAEEKTPGGLYLPDITKKKPQMGKVISVGPGKLLDDGERSKMSVKKDDTVVYRKYAENEFIIGGQEYIILSENDLLGVITF